jgi:calcineurin-like phosphoesterase family protein
MIGKCDHFDDNLVVNCSGKDDLGSMEQNLITNHNESISKEQIEMIRKIDIMQLKMEKNHRTAI